MGWLSKLFNLELDSKESSRPYSAAFGRNGSQSNNGSGSKQSGKLGDGSKNDAYNRLKLVLMHDRTQISPDVLSKMRDELVQVISKYVDIDREALELNLETESNTIALVANIPVMRMKTPITSETTDTPSTESGAAVTTSLEETATPIAASTTEGATPSAVMSQSVPSAPQPTLTQPTLKAPVATASATVSATVKPNPFGDTATTPGSSSLHPKGAPTTVTTSVTTGPKTPVATP